MKKYAVHSKDRQKLVQELIKKHPNSATHAIARGLMQDHGEWFPSYNAARGCVRYYRGENGQKARKFAKPELKKITPIPVSKAVPWVPYALDYTGDIAIISDIHLPYHNDQALHGALDEIERRNPGMILINGDMVDFYSISRYETNPKMRDTKGEIDTSRAFLTHLRERFPNAEIILKEGNHEERWYHNIYRKAPELSGIDCLSLESILETAKHGIKVIGDQRIIMAGKLPVLHGHELPKGLTNPVNPARGAFMRTLECGLVSHHHRSSEHTEVSMLGKTITCWSIACLADLNPEYARINRWNHGFAIVNIASDGMFHVENIRLLNGVPL